MSLADPRPAAGSTAVGAGPHRRRTGAGRHRRRSTGAGRRHMVAWTTSARHPGTQRDMVARAAAVVLAAAAEPAWDGREDRDAGAGAGAALADGAPPCDPSILRYLAMTFPCPSSGGWATRPRGEHARRRLVFRRALVSACVSPTWLSAIVWFCYCATGSLSWICPPLRLTPVTLVCAVGAVRHLVVP